MSIDQIRTPGTAQRATDISQATAVEQARAVAEVAAAIKVAQEFRRDEDRAWNAMTQACSRPAMAERAFYAVRNRGQGPSVHLARELARIWGNVDYGVKELRRDEHAGVSEVLAYAWDQETNVRSTRTFIVPHQRMAGGRRQALTDLQDVYLNNQNVGARAVRECIFTVLPTALTEEAQAICHRVLTVAAGGEDEEREQREQRVNEAVAAFERAGATRDQLVARFGPLADWTPETLANVRVLWTSLQRNEVTLAEAFDTGAPPTAGGQRVTVAEIQRQAAPPPADDDGFDPTADPSWGEGR